MNLPIGAHRRPQDLLDVITAIEKLRATLPALEGLLHLAQHSVNGREAPVDHTQMRRQWASIVRLNEHVVGDVLDVANRLMDTVEAACLPRTGTWDS